MNFKIIIAYNVNKITTLHQLSNTPENLQEFFHTFPEIEIVEESVGNTIIQTYYHISSRNIRKLKLLNIDNNNSNVIKLFKILYDKELIDNYGDEKPTIWWSGTGTSGSSGSSKPKSKYTFKKITKKFDPHKCLKMKKRFKI